MEINNYYLPLLLQKHCLVIYNMHKINYFENSFKEKDNNIIQIQFVNK